MYNEDLDALAAEYVLGTLAADERIHADTLIATDPGFGEIVHQWERRLGELNVMVEAIEPPPELWDKIESGMSARARSDEVGAGLAAATASAEAEAEATTEKAAASEEKAEAAAEAKAEEAKSEAAKGEGEAAQPGAAPPAAPMSPEGEPKAEAKSEEKSEGKPEAKPEAKSAPELKPQPRTPLYAPETESTQLLSLARRLRRWRLAAAALSLVAIALAALIALSAEAPDRIPLRAFLPAATRPTPPASVSRLIAVLQQEPSSPAFLLTVDPAARTLTVRRVAAKAQAGHSYELWMLAAQSKPRALGLVGDAEYTQQPLPSDFNVNAMRRARYEISFEPTGGSKSGAPTGPILFTGTLVESAQPPPPAPKS